MKNDNDSAQNDEYWMKKAIIVAQRARDLGEVPVGALLVVDKQLVSTGENRKEIWHTPLGHAELLALHRASQKLGRWRLTEATMYVTLEPCLMCAGAMLQARIKRLVFGATDPKGGAAKTCYQVLQDSRLNHQVEVYGGVLADACGELLTRFFKERRADLGKKQPRKLLAGG